MKLNLQKADVIEIRHHGCPNTDSHVVEIEAHPPGLPRRKAIRLMLPFAVLSFLRLASVKRSIGGS